MRVKVKSIDRSARYLSPSRTLEVRTRKGSFTTPTRASTSYEFRQKALVPTDMPINTEISIDVHKLNFKNISDFLTSNGYLNKLVRTIDLNNRLEQYSKLRISLLQPTTSETRDPKTKQIKYPSGMSVLQNDSNLLHKFLGILVKLQLAIGSDLITIPYLELQLATTKKVFVDVDKTTEKVGQQPFFVIDMRHPDFSEILDFLIKDLRSNMIGLIHREYLKNIHNYETVYKYAENDVSFFTMQVPRIDENRDNISTMHYLPFLANDIYSVEVPSIGGGTNKEKQKADAHKLERVKLFDRKSLQVNKIVSYENFQKKMLNEYNDDTIVRKILENYREADKDEDERKIQTLVAFSKFDELKSSSQEFFSLQRFIDQDSSKDYISEKKTLEKALNPLAQTKLA